MNTSREKFEREREKLRAAMHARKYQRIAERGANINWQRIALELRKHMALEQVSRKLGHHKDWLNQIARGEIKEPAFSDGVRLLRLIEAKIGLERMRNLT